MSRSASRSRDGAPGSTLESDQAREVSARGRWRRRVMIVGGAIAALVIITSPVWGRYLLSELSFFRVRKVEIDGLRYLDPGQVYERLAVDTLQSVWMRLAPLEERVQAHPQVASATVRRRLPGTIIVRVSENLPVALLAGEHGFRVLDESGEALPVDPSVTRVDLPIVTAVDTAVLQLLAGIRAAHPALFDRISTVRRVGRDELRVELATVPVRTMADVTVQRLAEILPVENDLASRQLQPVEIDLRFREQVIARMR
jgi:cell division septal protein FtsQ